MAQRSKLGSHWAGPGTELAFYEPQDTYYDVSPGLVRLPNDAQARENIHSLAGPVKRYFIDKEGNKIEGSD